MADRRNPWPRLLKYSQNRGEFCHVTHDEMAFLEVVSSVLAALFVFLQPKTLVQTKRKHFIVFTSQNPYEIFGAILADLAWGLSTILNEEKALWTRLCLDLNFSIVFTQKRDVSVTEPH